MASSLIQYRPGQNGGKISDYDFKCNSVNENGSISIFFIGCDWWEILINLNNGLAPNKRQAIIYTKMTNFSDAYMQH